MVRVLSFTHAGSYKFDGIPNVDLKAHTEESGRLDFDLKAQKDRLSREHWGCGGAGTVYQSINTASYPDPGSSGNKAE